MIRYDIILTKEESKLTKMESRLQSMEEHLGSHPKDYQAKVSSILLNSQILDKKNRLSNLDYLAKVELYK